MCILFYIREIFYKSLFIRLLPVISNTRQPSLEQLQSNFPANIYEMIMRGKNRQELPGVRNNPDYLYITFAASERYRGRLHMSEDSQVGRKIQNK